MLIKISKSGVAGGRPHEQRKDKEALLCGWMSLDCYFSKRREPGTLVGKN